MSLSENQKKHLRRLAHPLHPLVMVGNAVDEPGKLEAITSELDGALNVHELVKVSVRVGDREARNEVLSHLIKSTDSELVQRIGNVGVLFRPRKDKSRIILPDV